MDEPVHKRAKKSKENINPNPKDKIKVIDVDDGDDEEMKRILESYANTRRKKKEPTLMKKEGKQSKVIEPNPINRLSDRKYWCRSNQGETFFLNRIEGNTS